MTTTTATATATETLLGWNNRVTRPAPNHLIPTETEMRESLAYATKAGPFEWADVAWDLCDAGRARTAWAFWLQVIELYSVDLRVYLYASDAAKESGNLTESLKLAEKALALAVEQGGFIFEFFEAVYECELALGRTPTARSMTDEEGEEHIAPVVTVEQAVERLPEHLKSEGECDLFDLRYTLFDDEFLLFDVEEFAQECETDARFDVTRFEGAAYVSLAG